MKRAGSSRLAARLQDATARLNAGEFSAAEALCNEVLARAPRNPEALHLLGMARLASGDAARAASLIGQALEADPKNARMLEHRGVACLALADAGGAEAMFRQALRAGAAHGLLHMRLGLALEAQGRHEEAEHALSTAARVAPDDADVQLNLGNLRAARGRPDEALAAYRAALSLRPGSVAALCNIGTVLKDLGRLDEARQAYQAALDADPRCADARNGLGIAYEREERFDDAIAHYRAALAIEPDNVAAHCNLGSALRMLGRLDEAERHCASALERQPDLVDALLNLANVREQQLRLDEARACYAAALEREPGNAEIHFTLATLCLGAGDFEAGWAGYRWRPARQRAVAAGTALDDEFPQDLAGRTVLLLGEQGIGDELFFLRFAARLRALGARVIGECDPKILRPVERSGRLDAVIAPGAPPPVHDRTVMAADVPLLLRETGFPQALPLAALEQRVAAMRERLAGFGPPPYVGLTWRAGTPPAAQRAQRKRVLYKEVPLELLAGAMREIPGTLLAFQRHPRAGELAAISAAARRPVHDVSAANEDLEDMLALLSLADAYVGVSNTNMHLTAALGKQAHVLLPYPGEWRWMAQGEHSPWFPGFALYRQTAERDWAAALTRLAEDLRRVLAGSHEPGMRPDRA